MILILRRMSVSPLILVTYISRIQILRRDVYAYAIAKTSHHIQVLLSSEYAYRQVQKQSETNSVNPRHYIHHIHKG
ncbi:hypothetical protein [Nostoc sp.]|uniref:hypothetical protein n=1 Tax=Nostoc sp. TaxID=1180 RepID=UPI002FF5B05D